MHTPAWINLQLIRNGTHLLHDFEWTNPFWEKLAINLAMLYVQVLRIEKNLLSCFIELFDLVLIRIRLLSLLSSNQQLACQGESLLQSFNEGSRIRVHIIALTTHWSPRVAALIQVKRRGLNRFVESVVMGKFCT
jgi:hypothetical protein